jgi:hypothetical protein
MFKINYKIIIQIYQKKNIYIYILLYKKEVIGCEDKLWSEKYRYTLS